MAHSVYVAQAPSGAVKIGFTKRDPTARVAELRFDGEQPRLVAAIAHEGRYDALGGEGALLDRFAHLRISGEWHRPAPELLAFVESLGGSIWTPGPVEGDMA